ncbi:16S rRNA (cytosine(1402)-N(4))-methyltransferase RsmH [Microlunatus soli]|uniref:Ribosomal RNA small subunit methyltransferase H n=1 Tax=Microlunatus soli TaxID=630515 RepID=A0A1H1PFR7_9ACTN|nr:16S rRNA (cytosine(1402)-N(4))-methyltransferase RsmH [Microlunatus soli]SDS10106.1 16S rRNA (cytosine1402-N4)-methyltransferase [Microlunatus soli]
MADAASPDRTPPGGDQHIPVMLEQIVDLLAPALESSPETEAPILVDCTLGLGGHSAALLAACPQARLIGLDRDTQAIAAAGERLAAYADRIELVHAVYDELPEVLAERGITAVQGVLLDLGLSSLQIDRADRGFAYARDAPLDMRMDQTADLTAEEVVNSYSAAELTRILRDYGEERSARRIADAIVAQRRTEPISSSARLVQIISGAVPMALQRSGGHPAKRTFQALRIEVNHELEALRGVLPAAVAALDVGGRIAVLAYHSLEDRLVKQVLRVAASDRAPRGLPVVPPELGPELRLLTRGADRPDQTEADSNPRARSARLRAAVRIAPARGRAA